jgi:regulator of sigma E protease
MGLRSGDYITSLDGRPVKDVRRIPVEIIMNGINNIEGVHADGKKFSVPVSDEDRSLILKRFKKSDFVSPRFKAKVASIDSTTFAANANLKPEDRIVAINGVPVPFFDNLKGELVKNGGKVVDLTVLRGKDTVRTKCQVGTDGVIGFKPKEIEKFNIIPYSYTFFSAFREGVKDGMEQIIMQAKQFIVIFTVKDAYQQVGGFATMVKQMDTSWNWRAFWMFTGFLSLALAFMNFLPIPMLDGGYIMFILWEMITGKKVSDKVIYYANNVGLFIVLGLMIFANTDWLRN